MLVDTAGGTREPLDAVRYLGNRSSGRMGAAVADEAARRGADVTLIRSGGAVAPTAPMRVLHAESAADLEQRRSPKRPRADVVVMAAAVADYRPVLREPGKRTQERRALDGRARTHDAISSRRLGELAQLRASWWSDLRPSTGPGEWSARESKLERKGADMIVMNDVSRADIGFDVDANELTLVTADRRAARQPPVEAGVCICNLGCARAIHSHGCGRITDRHQPGRTNRGCTGSQRRGLLGGDCSRR